MSMGLASVLSWSGLETWGQLSTDVGDAVSVSIVSSDISPRRRVRTRRHPSDPAPKVLSMPGAPRSTALSKIRFRSVVRSRRGVVARLARHQVGPALEQQRGDAGDVRSGGRRPARTSAGRAARAGDAHSVDPSNVRLGAVVRRSARGCWWALLCHSPDLRQRSLPRR